MSGSPPAPSARQAIGAVVLAAGAGERLGRRPKCLIEFGGVTLIRRTLAALSGAGIDEVVVVLGHHAERIVGALAGLPVTAVLNEQPDTGPVSSQRLGLGALASHCDAVLMVLADQPLLVAQDILDLVAAWHQRPAGVDVLYPEGMGTRGNPVMLAAEVREQVLAADARTGCRQWQARHADRVAPFVTDNPHYFVDIDTPEDADRLARATGLAVQLPGAASG